MGELLGGRVEPEDTVGLDTQDLAAILLEYFHSIEWRDRPRFLCGSFVVGEHMIPPCTDRNGAGSPHSPLPHPRNQRRKLPPARCQTPAPAADLTARLADGFPAATDPQTTETYHSPSATIFDRPAPPFSAAVNNIGEEFLRQRQRCERRTNQSQESNRHGEDPWLGNVVRRTTPLRADGRTTPESGNFKLNSPRNWHVETYKLQAPPGILSACPSHRDSLKPAGTMDLVARM